MSTQKYAVVGGLLVLAAVAAGTLLPRWNTQKEAAPAPEKAEQTDDRAEQTQYVDVELDVAKQKQVWEAEHVTFELEQRFGKAFRRALLMRDLGRLIAFFQDTFQGVLPSSFTEAPFVQAGITEISRRPHGAAVPADADAIVSHLLDWLGRPPIQIDRVGLRVLAIERLESSAEAPITEGNGSDQKAESNLWKTTLLLTAHGEDGQGHPIERESRHRAVFEVVDEQALAETPSLRSWEVLSETLRVSQADPLFEEITGEAGLDRIGLPDNWKLRPQEVTQYRFQIAVEDFDGDGLLDIAVATHRESMLLMRPAPDQPFRDVTERMGIKRHHARLGTPGTLTAVLDANNDGHPDLLLGTRFYLNQKGRRFVDRTDESGLRFLPASEDDHIGEPMGACIADYDCDGLLDIYVVKQGSSPRGSRPTPWINDEEHGYPNQLWRNLGGGRFFDVTEASGTGGGARHSLAACWFFYDEDRFPDLYVANDFGRNVLLRNRGDGTFEDLSEASGAADFATTMGVAAGDLNNDAVTELYVANMYSKMGRRIIGLVSADDYPPGIYEQIQGSCAGNRLYWRKGGQPKFQERGAQLGVDAVGWAYAPAMLDVDNDGWLDLYATTGFLSFRRDKPDG